MPIQLLVSDISLWDAPCVGCLHNQRDEGKLSLSNDPSKLCAAKGLVLLQKLVWANANSASRLSLAPSDVRPIR